MPEPAENLEENPLKEAQTDEENEKNLQDSFGRKKKSEKTIDKRDLTPSERIKLEKGDTTPQKLAEEKIKLEASAKAELDELVTATAERENVIDLKQYRKYSREIEETKSPEKLEELLGKIQDLPKQKEKEEEQRQEEEKKLPPNHPELLKLQRKFNQICDANMHLIGTTRLKYFTDWFEDKKRENPTIANLKDIIKRLEGKEVFDKDGLAPRREEFSSLERIFQKYGLSNPLQSTFVKEMGLSGRREFRQNAEKFEEHFDTVKDTGFYSKEVIQKSMRKILLANSLGEQKNLILTAKNIARKESETFTHLDSKITISGTTIRKMSEASKAKLMEYYKNTDFKERKNLVNNWEKLVENEANLAKELEKIYKNDKEGLKLALESFSELDYIQKQKALREHSQLVEKTENKEELQKNLIIKAAHAKIDEAARKKIIARGESKTQGRYKKFFENPENFKNPTTKKIGDINEMKKAYEILTAQSPSEKYKNLASYADRRKEYQKDLGKLADINPDLKKEELQKWQDKYDIEGWTKRETVHKDLKSEIEKQKIEQAKKKAKEEEIGLTKTDKEKAKEEPLELQEAIRTTMELLKDERAAEAMKVLLEYNETDPDNPKILFWIETVGRYMKEFGSGKKLEKTKEMQVEEEIKKIAESDQEVKDELEEENLLTLNLEGTSLSEERHQRKKSAQERAKEESMGKTSAKLEKDLTEDFYQQTAEAHQDKEFILDETGKGEQIKDVEIKDTKMTDQERQSLKEKTREKEGRLFKKEGFTHITMKDKSGRKLSSEEAAAQQEKKIDKLEQKIAEKAKEKVKGKNGLEFLDLTAEIAAKRKAGELIDKERHKHERLRAA